MENHLGLWVAIIIIFFLLSNFLNFRISPRDKALGQLRDRARKMGLNPRLVPAPDWLNLPKQGNYKPMIAYYYMIIPDGKLPLLQAIVDNQQLQIIVGNLKYQPIVQLSGLYAVEMQANSVAVYWDENQDIKGQHLSELKNFLENLVQASYLVS